MYIIYIAFAVLFFVGAIEPPRELVLDSLSVTLGILCVGLAIWSYRR